jgi:rhodanese-related sulfurtransferase
MKKFFSIKISKVNLLRVLAVLTVFAIILFIGLLSKDRQAFTYKQDMNQSLAELDRTDAFFYPWQLEGVLNAKNTDVVLFDIRDQFVYGQGNIPGSENISAHDLTLKENIERLENLRTQGITVVLYGDDQLQANGPWMLFRQVGFDNVKILIGGYQYYSRHKENLAVSKNDSALIFEIPRYDFEKTAKQSSQNLDNNPLEKKSIVVERKQKSGSAGGGC